LNNKAAKGRQGKMFGSWGPRERTKKKNNKGRFFGGIDKQRKPVPVGRKEGGEPPNERNSQRKMQPKKFPAGEHER